MKPCTGGQEFNHESGMALLVSEFVGLATKEKSSPVFHSSWTDGRKVAEPTSHVGSDVRPHFVGVVLGGASCVRFQRVVDFVGRPTFWGRILELLEAT
jgi:hypothetical protein